VLEEARQAKQIGKALGCPTWSSPDLASALAAGGGAVEDLRELLNVSQLRSGRGSRRGIRDVHKAAGEKSERCCTGRPASGASAEHPTLCRRCVEVVRPGLIMTTPARRALRAFIDLDALAIGIEPKAGNLR
jgi:isoleucyl-tRNA synthetase